MTPEYVNILRNTCQEKIIESKFHEEHSGPEHDKIWTVIVFINNIEVGRGTGKTRQSAKAEAAKLALEG